MSSDLEDLEKRIQHAKKNDPDVRNDEQAKRQEASDNMNNGLRAGMELVAAIGGSAFIGWLLDGWLETKPFFLIAMLILGIITGFVNVYRLSQNMGNEVGYLELHNKQKQAKNAPETEESNKHG